MRAALIVSAAVSWLALNSLRKAMRRYGEPYAIASLVILVALGLEYCLRPLAIASSGEYGWDPESLTKVTAADAHAILDASVIGAITVLVFTIVVRIVATYRVAGSPSAANLRRADLLATRNASRTVVPLLIVANVVSVGLALTYGSFGQALAGNLGRENVTSGYVFSLVNLAPTAVVIVLRTATLEQLRTKRIRMTLWLTFAATLSVETLILGGRAEIITFATAAIVLARSRFGAPNGRRLVLAIIVAILASSVYRVASREAYYPQNYGTPRSTLIARSFENPLALITRGDISSFDKLIVISASDARLSPGSTYEAAALAPLPGKATANHEGGNVAFTRLFLPDRFERGVTYEGVSWVGEGILNFGVLGALAVIALFGVAYGFLLRRARFGVTVTLALALGLLPAVVRGDAFNLVALTFSIGMCVAITAVLRVVMVGTRPVEMPRRLTPRAPVPRPAVAKEVLVRGSQPSPQPRSATPV